MLKSDKRPLVSSRITLTDVGDFYNIKTTHIIRGGPVAYQSLTDSQALEDEYRNTYFYIWTGQLSGI